MQRSAPLRSLAIGSASLVLGLPASAQTWFVRHQAAPGGDGTSWASAFRTVQDGLAATTSGDEVWVARGFYRPGDAASPRTATFQVPGGVTLYGGFAGDESSRDEREWASNPTVLTGDLARNDGPNFQNRNDNCFHVVRVAEGASVVVDGLVISGGFANGANEHQRGAGIYVEGALTLRNSRIEDNKSSSSGGAIYADGGGVTLEDCTVRGNAPTAIVLYQAWPSRFERCNVHGNAGTGIRADEGGGPVLESCSVSGNTGDGVFIVYTGTLLLTNCTIANNGAASILDTHFGEDATIRNSILWGNGMNPGILDMTLQNSVAETTQGYPWIQDPRIGDDPATPPDLPLVDLGAPEFVCDCDEVASYCTAVANSSGGTAAISWSGSTSLAADALQLHVEGCPPFRLGIFYYGSTQVELPYGDGVRCVGGSIFRLPILTTDADGMATHHLDFDVPPAGAGAGELLEGSTWNLSFFFRDPPGGPAGWNDSDASSVRFCR